MKRIIGRINPEDKNVYIWGAGFSGLILGHYLKDKGYKVTIYEKSNKIGGKIGTKKTPSGLVEKGANALYMNADAMDLLKDLKLSPLPATKKLKRLLLIEGKPKRPIQLSILSKLTINGLRKPPLISDGLSVAEFFRPLIGTEDINKYISPILGGIYATPAEQLHFKSIFYELSNFAQFDSYWEFLKIFLNNQKRKPKLEISGSVSFEGGMQTLINRLGDGLKHEIKLNYKEPFKLRGNTIICTDAPTASQLLRDIRPEFSKELGRIRYQELTTTTVFLKREIRSLQRAFGVLIPLGNHFNSIGVINNKALFPANNQNVCSYTFISPKKCSNDDVMSDIKSLYSEFEPSDIDHIENTYWDRALPIYDLQRFLSVKKLHLIAQRETQLALSGNYVAGISIREMITAAREFSHRPADYQEII
jgi:oxygen-dependent protoporphyrinogen oxidase